MSGGVEKHLEAGAKLIKLALALYRKESTQLPDAEHAESMLLLLRLANGDAELMAWARQLTKASEDELHQACIAFIEHAFFTVANNHFGVLGLNPWAQVADIKEHYRLLMRLFHPDRGLVNSTSADRYAAMINQAYAALKQEIPFAAEVTNQRSAALSKQQAQSSAMHGRMLHAALADHADVNYLTWITPTKMLLILALLASLLVWMLVEPYEKLTTGNVAVVDVISSNADSGVYDVLDQGGQQLEAIAHASVAAELDLAENSLAKVKPIDVQRLAEDAMLGTEKLDREKLRTDQSGVNLKPASSVIKESVQLTLQQAHVSPQPKLIAQPKVTTQPKINNTALASAVAGNKNVDVSNLNVSAILPNSLLAVSEQPAADIVSTANTAVSSAKMLRIDNDAETIPTTRELRELLMLFTDGYERGDIDTFMQAFGDELASDEVGGRPGFKHAYAFLFETTKLREIAIHNMHWSRKAKLTLGEADYRIRTKDSSKSEVYDSHGTFRFEVVKVNNKAKIIGFYYVVDND